MKILFVNDYNFVVGGVEIFLFRLKSELEENNHEIIIFGSNKKENIKSFFSRFYSFYWKKKIISTIKDFNPDIIHLNMISRVLSVSMLDACKDSKKPFILHIHESNWAQEVPIWKFFNPYYLLKSLKVNLHKSLIKKTSSDILFASNFMKSKFSKIFKKNKLIKQNYGIQIPKEKTNYKKTILFAGRLVKEKGLHTIINSLNKVKDYEFLILGEGPQKKELESKYKNVKFLGFQNPEKYYKNSSILVMPSIWEEPFGLSVTEAMSYGLCVIASNIGGIPEQIQHMQTGLLFEPGNEKDFTEKLNYLLKNPSEIKRMGKNARKFARANYDWNNIVKEYEELYEITIMDFKK